MEGNTFSLSPNKCSGILSLLMGGGSCCKFAMMSSRELPYSDEELSFGYIICMQFSALFDS